MRSVLVMGLGSSGQRFVRILRKLYGESLQIYVLRRGKNNILISNDLQSAFPIDPCVHYKLTEIENLAQLKGIFLDLIIISSISSAHFQDIELISEIGFKNILVEKPLLLPKNLEQSAQVVLELLNQHGCASGYFTRLHPLAQKLKSLIDNGSLGRPLVYRSWYGEKIEEMHPYEDHAKSYAANELMGGGPLNTFSHDLDLLYYLFDEVSDFKFDEFRSNWSKIQSQEIQTLQASGEVYGYRFLIQASFDFVTWPKSRGGEMVFELGTIRWNWQELSIKALSIETGLETYDFSSVDFSILIEEAIRQLMDNSYNPEVLEACWRDFVRVGVILSQYNEIR